MARSCSLLYRREQSNVMKLIYSNRRYYHVSLIEDWGVESRGFPNDTEGRLQLYEGRSKSSDPSKMSLSRADPESFARGDPK